MKRLKQCARAGACVLLSCCALIGAYAALLALSGNVHCMSEGQVYRSGQPSATQIEHLAREHGIKSILNLCGPGRGAAYCAETNSSALLGLVHMDFKLSARRQLKEAEMDKLVEIMRELPTPVLVHCTGGADRTGLACALYRFDVLGEPAEKAAKELNFLYGHIPHFNWRYSIAMDHSFWSHVTNHSAGVHAVPMPPGAKTLKGDTHYTLSPAHS